ncbi:YceD family protein [Rhodococcus sp. IEGM 1408]|uniref:YceD family protein n=1 Tax=Rhodococcus sp. IEGM 1408 TaxID=3082220 RepID=UPI0029537601|nr:YceD family protein [Rhodococcus sp. IEGM 1408]MDV8000478.1 YceD family protein [Rhodococcus sp. IEGM 1408]
MSTSSRTPRHHPRPAADSLVLDTRTVARTPGATAQVQRSAVLPSNVGVELMKIPAKSEVELDLTLTFIDEGVLVTGSVTGHAEVECARCLGRFTTGSTVYLTEMYAAEGTATAAGAEEDDVRLLDGDLLDLEPALVDAFGLRFPMSPTCTDYGHDECVNPDTPAPDGISGSTEGRIDPRWAGLAEKFGTTGAAEETE